jgi:hypothetical protein
MIPKSPCGARFTARDVAAWATHVAYACRVRMRVLETPILREIHDGHLTASATLVRAHLETAGLAAHAFFDRHRRSEVRG